MENLEHGQTIQFIEKRAVESSIKDKAGRPMSPPTFETVNDGTTNEEVLTMLIDRLEHLNQKLGHPLTFLALHHCGLALSMLMQRTAERQARGVEGTPQR